MTDVTLEYLEVCGFRSFGVAPQRISLSSSLSVIHADNSQGKTSLAEALEFLLTGSTSRRQLGGGSPQEFSNALRNVHLPAGARVYVEAGLLTNEGTHILRRTLLEDYARASDCVSRLELDGNEIDDVRCVGVPLAGPPIAAPVLLEHTLRFAVSAKPSDRSDFFRAILDASDLDTIRTTIDNLIAQRSQRPSSQLLSSLQDLQQSTLFGRRLTGVSLSTQAELEEALRRALRELVPLDNLTSESSDTIIAALDDVNQERKVREQRLLPLADLEVGLPTRVVGVQSVASDCAHYQDALAATGEQVAGMLPVFEAVLQASMPGLDHPESSVDCPLCLSPSALTASRVDAIRSEVAARTGLIDLQRDTQARLASVRRAIGHYREQLSKCIPGAARWNGEEQTKFLEHVLDLGVGDDGDITEILRQGKHLAIVVDEAGGLTEELIKVLSDLEEQITASRPLDPIIIAKVDSQIHQLETTWLDVAELAQSYATHSSRAFRFLRTEVANQASTSGWRQLVELGRRVDDVWYDLDAAARHGAVIKRLKATQKQIVVAARKVLDDRLSSMAQEIRVWWTLLRPGELTTFGDLTRRSTANKMLDLTALLVPEPTSPGESRSALAVLSNSQLNALGLSTFLARSVLLNAGFVFLDDPVPGSDPEHRVGFAEGVVGALLDKGYQVIVSTHDPVLARDIETFHGHRSLACAGIVIASPIVGSEFLERGDDFEQLMLDAKGQMPSPLPANRRSAGNYLRTAAERLAKHITVQGRQQDGDASASLADYDRKNLSYLGPSASQFAVQPNIPGIWTSLARILNNADHDAPPPSSIDLKRCHDWLRDLKRKHNVRTQS